MDTQLVQQLMACWGRGLVGGVVRCGGGGGGWLGRVP